MKRTFLSGFPSLLISCFWGNLPCSSHNTLHFIITSMLKIEISIITYDKTFTCIFFSRNTNQLFPAHSCIYFLHTLNKYAAETFNLFHTPGKAPVILFINETVCYAWPFPNTFLVQDKPDRCSGTNWHWYKCSIVPFNVSANFSENLNFLR